MASSSASAQSLSIPVAQEEEESSDTAEELPADEPDLEDEPDISPEELEKDAQLHNGNAAVDSIIDADNIAEWVDTILDDAAPLDPPELAALAVDCLKTARRNKDFRGSILFAALADFYRWMPRMGRLRAALRVAKNHGHGPAFQRVLCAQARFFEANGSLKASHQGQREKGNGLLDNEGFYMGVQRWLRTLEVGTVSDLFPPSYIKDLLTFLPG
jgi:hypothetical protein